MWLFSEIGFLWIVEDRKDASNLNLRARLREDLETFVRRVEAPRGETFEVRETPERDYRFRAFVPKSAVAGVVRDMVAGIEYPNSKDSVHGRAIRRAYYRSWDAMFTAQRRAMSPGT